MIGHTRTYHKPNFERKCVSFEGRTGGRGVGRRLDEDVRAPFLRPIFKSVDAFGAAVAIVYLSLCTVRGTWRRRITTTLAACAVVNVLVLAPKIGNTITIKNKDG